MGAAGRPVTRLRAVPRAIAPPMASKDRNEEYAASEARSSSANAGPSVRGHSNIPSPHIPSPLLARLTTRSIAQRSGSKTALARLWRVARESVSSLLAAVRQVLPWIEVAHYLDKFGAPPRSTTAPSKRLAHLRSSECRVPRRAHPP